MWRSTRTRYSWPSGQTTVRSRWKVRLTSGPEGWKVYWAWTGRAAPTTRRRPGSQRARLRTTIGAAFAGGGFGDQAASNPPLFGGDSGRSGVSGLPLGDPANVRRRADFR